VKTVLTLWVQKESKQEISWPAK